MRVKIERTIGNFVILVTILAVMIPGALASSEPSYTPPSISVDGDISDWDLNADHFAKMTKSNNPDPNNPVFLSDLYLRYDCENGILYAMVLLRDGVITDFDPEEHHIKLDGNNNAFLDGDDFEFFSDGSGWEVGFPYSGQHTLNVHTLVDMSQVGGDDDETSSVQDIPLVIGCDPFIPEFPTIALPIAAILGLMFIFGRKRDL